jgi:putative Holliday junction resolvase
VPRVLAIDPGERRLGLAVSDPTGAVALPLEVVRRTGWAAEVEHLRRVIERYDVGEIVVGRPLTAAGLMGPQAQRAARFAARLRRSLGMKVEESDERFTTAAADRALREGGGSGRARRTRQDAVAAALILQPYLDRRRRDDPLREN